MKTISLSSHGSFIGPEPEVAGTTVYPSVRNYPSIQPCRPPSPGAPQLPVEGSSFLRRVRDVVLHRLRDDLRVEELAAAVFLSRVQVFRKIKALTGQSPSQFIRHIRLQKALELLYATDLTISDIAYGVGFSDPKYFSRVFAQAFGTAPSVWRQKM